MKALEALEQFVQLHSGLMTSIGVVLLIAMLTLWTTWITNRAASKRLKHEAKISGAMKIADFRREWIEDFRSDLASFSAIASVYEDDVQLHGPKLLEIMARTHMRMNAEDEESRKLLNLIVSCMDKEQAGKLSSIQAELVVLGQSILKQEWERLKADLKAVEDSIS